MGDARFPGLEQLVDLSQQLLVGVLDASVLLLVLLPATDDEQFAEQAPIADITVQMPVHRPGPAAQTAQVAGEREERVDLRWLYRVVDGHGQRGPG